jgi:hypothetical protein
VEKFETQLEIHRNSERFSALPRFSFGAMQQYNIGFYTNLLSLNIIVIVHSNLDSGKYVV